MGCLLYGIITLFIGAFICVTLGIESDSAVGMFICFSCVFGPIIAMIVSAQAKEKEEAAQAEKDRLEKQRIEKEEKRLVEINKNVNTILHQYEPLPLGENRDPIKLSVDPIFINKEIVSVVKSYRAKTSTIYENYASISRKTKEILSCYGCNSIDDKYSHLQANMDDLKRLKNESDKYLAELSKFKIKILNDDSELLFCAKLAFLSLLNSKKCLSENGNIKDFISSVKPLDLMMFEYDYEPVILFLNPFYFCMFGNVILVFDNTGKFSTAIDPTALNIRVEKKVTSVYVNNGTPDNNQHIAEDSKCISQGITRTTWLHTCRDGSPDLRYNYNPRSEYRIDMYEYVEIEFVIGDNAILFSASSGTVGDAFDKFISQYVRKCNNKHNPIPELIQLMKVLNGSDDSQLDIIVEVCESRTDASNYFCKLITNR